MKRIVSIALALATVLTLAAGSGFIVQSDAKSAAQVVLLAVLPVDAKEANPGVKQYTELVSSKKIYEAGDPIMIATVVEVRNLANYPTLDSIDGVYMDLKIESQSVDLSTCNIAASVVYNVLAADRNSVVEAATNTVPIESGAIQYNAADNSAVIHCKGVPNGSVTAVDGKTYDGRQINQGLGKTGLLQAYAAFNGLDKGGKSSDVVVYLPALNAAKYSGDVLAPDAVQYSFIITGIARNYTKGDMSSRVALYR